MSEYHTNLTPTEMVEYTAESGEKKAHRSILRQTLMGYIGGVFIGLATYGSLAAAHGLLNNPATYGIGKLVSGIVFAAGLIMVLISGGDLFTGNTLLFVSFLKKKIALWEMLENWIFVYLGNFLGALTMVFLIIVSGMVDHQELLGVVSLNIAVTKVNYSFIQAFVLGVLCNILVAGAVWMSYSTKTVSGKIWAIFFPVMLFILSGYEHSVANMFYVPFGLFLKGHFSKLALAGGASEAALANLNIQSLLMKSLVPVTLGNIVGGCLLIGGLYWFVNKNDKVVEH